MLPRPTQSIRVRQIPATWRSAALVISAALALCASTVAAKPKVGAIDSDSLTVEPYALRTYDGVEHTAEILSFRVPENQIGRAHV